ncbi:MAG: SDR family NAD(P)-dependent oxidoreductase [Microthrixaceae bacterium]
MSELGFDDRVVVITGAGRGLGKAYALLMGSLRARVVVNDPGAALDGSGLDPGPAERVVEAITGAGGQAVACTESVATPEGGRAIIAAALERWGRIDALVHNAGNIAHRRLADMTIEDFDAVLDVHLRGAFHVVQPAFTPMAEAGYGRIVLTSSIGGLYGNHGVANYAASKGGIIGLNNVVALEGADRGIASNVIVPGALTRIAAGADSRGMPESAGGSSSTRSSGSGSSGTGSSGSGGSAAAAAMTADNVAPVVAWLSHEQCSVSGELFIAMAGRVARAFVGETPGVYQPEWTIDDVAARIDEIRNLDSPWVFPVLPHGHADHIRESLRLAEGD